MAKRSKKIVKYRKPVNLNLGVIIFAIIFVYIIMCVFLSFTKSRITPYEVKIGSLAQNNNYEGLILRKEEVVTSASSGYVNYYARESERVSTGSMIYTVDESGKMADVMNASAEDNNSVSDEDREDIRSQIASFGHQFDDRNFEAVYDFKFDMEGTVMKMANYQVLSNLNALTQNGIAELVDFNYAPKSGILVYNTDGMESLTMDTVTPESFDKTTYEKKMMHSNDLVGQGDPVYKLITEEDWSLVILIESEERAKELEEEGYIEVRFLKTGTTSWAAVSIIRRDGKIYAKLDFTNSMITFATDRFIEVELLTSGKEGLKIPNSAIVEREFYLIPADYLTKGGDSGEDGFMRETYMEDGTVTTEFVKATIYNSQDDEYFVDERVFQIGDYIIKPDSAEKYPISKKGTLVGVYNINQGYADFRQISILHQNDEYSIVKSNTAYGLNVYDHIVLNGESVNEDDFIFEMRKEKDGNGDGDGS